MIDHNKSKEWWAVIDFRSQPEWPNSETKIYDQKVSNADVQATIKITARPHRAAKSTTNVRFSLSISSAVSCDEPNIYLIARNVIDELTAHLTSVGFLLQHASQIIVAKQGKNISAWSKTMTARPMAKPESATEYLKAIKGHGDIDKIADKQYRACCLASRRLISARDDDDLADKFSDVWEACEYLSNPKIWKEKKYGTPEKAVAALFFRVTGVPFSDLLATF